MDTEDAATRTAPAVYLPGMDAEGDELVYDPSAYLMYVWGGEGGREGEKE